LKKLVTEEEEKKKEELKALASGLFWFKWGTHEVFEFDLKINLWRKRTNLKPAKPFLLFQISISLPKNLGLYLIGGVD